MFFHRRKFLRSELLSAFKKRLGKPEVDEIMAQLGVPAAVRAEELSVSEMLALAEGGLRVLRCEEQAKRYDAPAQ